MRALQAGGGRVTKRRVAGSVRLDAWHVFAFDAAKYGPQATTLLQKLN
jgi:hypothetical protein